MPTNLLAICRPNETLQVKRVKTTPGVQEALAAAFTTQEQQFNEGVTTEIPFDGGWKPDKHEVLIAGSTPEMKAVWEASLQNITALTELNAANFQSEAIKGLAVVAGNAGNRRLLIQTFSARQILERSFAFVLDGDTFRKLSEPAFTLGSNVCALLDENSIRFKSYSNVRMIFDLLSLYTEASDSQIEHFAQHASLSVADVNAFKGVADQGIRKLVNAISSKGVLDAYDVGAIVSAASSHGFPVSTHQGKIIVPANRADAKKLLHFLDEGFYRGAMTGTPYITNSKRQMH
jgi:hypothetical protein